LRVLLLALFAGLPSGPSMAAEDAADAREELEEITSRLNALDAWMSNAQRRQRTWQRELRSTDQHVAATAARIRTIESNLRSRRAELDTLSAERDRLQTVRREQARRIADHLASAYHLSGDDFFKSLLNQERPDEFARMMRYHRYLSSARADSLAGYEATLAALEANLERVRNSEQALAAQQQQLDERRRDLGQRKQERSALLSRLKSDMSDRAAQRTRLAADQTRLESLVEELARRAQRLDGDTFVNSRGALPWPVRGQVTHRFGKERAGGRLKWQGVFIEAADGSEVRAIHSGRVAFADWLRGFGLLTIIDHGSGYMTLYAHTDVLYKNVGDWVEGGEPIATAGTSGGQPDSGLYFEIRASGTPRDPLGWLSRR
jgi:septal ring factor EnvC (AmiA/AmiB activator)